MGLLSLIRAGVKSVYLGAGIARGPKVATALHGLGKNPVPLGGLNLKLLVCLPKSYTTKPLHAAVIRTFFLRVRLKRRFRTFFRGGVSPCG